MVAKLCSLAIRDRIEIATSMTIVPIPSHWIRVTRQQFEPTLIIADTLSRELKLPINKSLLKRVVYTMPQAGMNAADRLKNMNGAFRATGESPKRVLLVDDVYTTGATTKSAARTLKQAGAREVQIVAAAYVT